MQDTPLGTVETWWQLLEVSGDLVRYEIRYRFSDSGGELVSLNELRFRTDTELTEALTETGFVVEQVYGDWDRGPAGPTSPELIYVALRVGE